MKKLFVFGNLGRDPELKKDANGNEFVIFAVAVNSDKKADNKADWIEVSCTGKLAEIVIKFAKKGSKVFVEGFPAIKLFTNNITKETVAVQRLYAHSIEVLTRPEIETY